MRKEDSLQIACVTWFKYQYPNHFITSFPAGYVFAGDKTKRSIMGKRMKDMGYRNGTPDILIPHGNKFYFGLFVELKTGNNKLSQEQGKAIFELEKNGYKCAVCYLLDEFIEVVNDYFKQV